MSNFKTNMSKLHKYGFRTGDNPYYLKVVKAFFKDPQTGLFPSSSVTKATFQPFIKNGKEMGTVVQLNLRQYLGSDEETQKHRSIRDVFQKQFGEGVELTCFPNGSSFVRALVITTKNTDLVKLWEQIWTLIQDFDDHKFSTYQQEKQEQTEGPADPIKFNWAESFADAPALPSNTNGKETVVQDSATTSVSNQAPAQIQAPVAVQAPVSVADQAPAPAPNQAPAPAPAPAPVAVANQAPAPAPAPAVNQAPAQQAPVVAPAQVTVQDEVQEYQQYFPTLLDQQINTLICMDMEISGIRQHLKMKIKERAVIEESVRNIKGIYNL